MPLGDPYTETKLSNRECSKPYKSPQLGLSCTVNVRKITFTVDNISNSITLFNVHGFPVQFEIASNRPDYYRIKTSRGEISGHSSVSVKVRLSSEKATRIYSAQYANLTNVKTHYIKVKFSSPNCGTLSTNITSNIQFGGILNIQRPPIPAPDTVNTLPTAISSMTNLSASVPTLPSDLNRALSPLFTNVPKPLKSCLKTSLDKKKDQEEVDDDIEVSQHWKGIIHYLPIVFGAIIVFLTTKIHKIDNETSKLLWASFMIGLGAMFVQLKLLSRGRQQ
ncbi:hypothetical protein AKO1_003938 [Acrasis kona]|uniref:MSP domain-containing protein n=1 Tax=Acrasis kona TaxID=1008807 RepID=A0AAW2ZIW3_9EUKA